MLSAADFMLMLMLMLSFATTVPPMMPIGNASIDLLYTYEMKLLLANVSLPGLRMNCFHIA